MKPPDASMKISSQAKWVAAVITAVLAVAMVIVLFGGGGPAGASGAPVIICVDSTVSTDDVRESYRPDIEAAVSSAVRKNARLYAAACGPNSTGEVSWPIHRKFKGNPYGNSFTASYIKAQVDSLRDPLDEILATTSPEGGTPLGEMLAVAARQCEYAGGNCTIYLFTDGEWADRLLRVSDGLTEAEQDRYLETYEDRLGDLSGTTFNFVGVGLGTNIGEVRLSEARAIASALIAAAGGELGSWTTRLS